MGGGPWWCINRCFPTYSVELGGEVLIMVIRSNSGHADIWNNSLGQCSPCIWKKENSVATLTVFLYIPTLVTRRSLPIVWEFFDLQIFAYLFCQVASPTCRPFRNVKWITKITVLLYKSGTKVPLETFSLDLAQNNSQLWVNLGSFYTFPVPNIKVANVQHNDVIPGGRLVVEFTNVKSEETWRPLARNKIQRQAWWSPWLFDTG